MLLVFSQPWVRCHSDLIYFAHARASFMISPMRARVVAQKSEEAVASSASLLATPLLGHLCLYHRGSLAMFPDSAAGRLRTAWTRPRAPYRAKSRLERCLIALASSASELISDPVRSYFIRRKDKGGSYEPN